jgi:Tryptophan-rich Synechocystis species C-terminal domain/Putative esterase
MNIADSVIESFGSTSLVGSGNTYLLEPNGGSAVQLSYNGAAVVAGQFGAWTLIAAEQTATGYEVALKVPGADQYTIWFTDAAGNYLSSPFGGAASGAQVEPYEASFQQDLNGDGTIGVPSPTVGGPAPTGGTVIESFGSTSLVGSGNTYLLEPNGGSAVQLSYNGAAVVAGQFGAWTLIAAEQTATGYEVALKVPGADQYTIWFTDAAGNYLSSPFGGAASGAQVEPYEASFQQDLNGDGTIGVPGSADQPVFAYQGTDANGAQIYDVTWSNSGLQPFAVRVLTPQHPSAAYPHSFLYDLPVEPGLAQSTWGSGLNELQNQDVEDQYNATIVEPIFPTYSWYADSSTDATVNYETFMADILPKWVESNFSTTGTEKNLLVGFSKSGYGALDLELKHPSVFSAVAAFDFPADMTSDDQYGGGANYGTQANFQENYELSSSFVSGLKAPFTTQDRILISEGPAFQSDVADFDTLLTAQGVMHTLLNQTNDTHSWSGGWLSSAIAGLYGMEKNLNSGAT